MKKITALLPGVLLILLLVSCNMDSQTGLFQEAGQSVKKESYVIKKVIAKDSSSLSYLVAADEGIFVYSGKEGRKLTSTVSNGKTARNVIWGSLTVSGDSYTWECIYYDETGDGRYHTIDQDGKIGDYDALDEKKFIPLSSSFEKCEGTSDTVSVCTFKSPDGSTSYYSITDAKPTSDSLKEVKWTDSTTEKEISLTQVTYIGGNYFIGVSGDKAYTWKAGGTGEEDTNQKCAYANSIFLTSSNAFYKNGEQIASVSGTSYSKSSIHTIVSGSDTWFILPSVNEVYLINGEGELVKKSCSSLSSIEVIFVEGITDGSYINVITAESGAKCINLNDMKIDSSWR